MFKTKVLPINITTASLIIIRISFKPTYTAYALRLYHNIGKTMSKNFAMLTKRKVTLIVFVRLELFFNFIIPGRY